MGHDGNGVKRGLEATLWAQDGEMPLANCMTLAASHPLRPCLQDAPVPGVVVGREGTECFFGSAPTPWLTYGGTAG